MNNPYINTLQIIDITHRPLDFYLTVPHGLFGIQGGLDFSRIKPISFTADNIEHIREVCFNAWGCESLPIDSQCSANRNMYGFITSGGTPHKVMTRLAAIINENITMVSYNPHGEDCYILSVFPRTRELQIFPSQYRDLTRFDIQMIDRIYERNENMFTDNN